MTILPLTELLIVFLPALFESSPEVVFAAIHKAATTAAGDPIVDRLGFDDVSAMLAADLVFDNAFHNDSPFVFLVVRCTNLHDASRRAFRKVYAQARFSRSENGQAIAERECECERNVRLNGYIALRIS